MSKAELLKVTQNKINQLSQTAGRSPVAVLGLVFRDGFAAVEMSIKENAIAAAQFETGDVVPHAEVMRNVQRQIWSW